MAKYQEQPGLSITRITSGDIPPLDFASMKNHVLGKKYELSLVFVDPKRSAELHETWKNKSGPADILSFPLSENEGEMFICLSQVRKKAKDFERTYYGFLAFIFIHGLVHLKGHRHGSTMDAIEEKARKHFGI